MTSDPSAADIHGRDFPAGAVLFEEGDRGRWEALAAGELAEVPELVALGAEGVAAELLEARLPPAAPGGVHEHLALKRRFEPEERRGDPR